MRADVPGSNISSVHFSPYLYISGMSSSTSWCFVSKDTIFNLLFGISLFFPFDFHMMDAKQAWHRARYETDNRNGMPER